MKYLLSALITLGFYSQAHAAEWTYRLKVIDETKYNSLLGQKLKVADLSSVTTIREIKVQGGETLPSPTLQNETFQICQVQCPGEKGAMPPAKPTKINGHVVEFIYPVDSEQFRQANLFYHLNHSWNKFAELGYKPTFQKQIKIRSDRKLNQLLEKGDMSNNAFFDDTDNSLNFVPSKTVLILKGLLGKVNYIDTAYDPIVMAHELSHLVIHDSIGHVPSNDFGGIHEGMADFFALNFYKTSHQGIIFGAGKPIRSAVGKDQYKVGMEVHDRGLVLVQTLFEMESTLAKSASPQEITQAAFDSLPCLKEEYHRILPAALECFLQQPLVRDQQDTLIRLAENHKIPLKSYMTTTKDLPSDYKMNSYIITKDSMEGNQAALYAKIETGARTHDLGLFRVQTKSSKSGEYSTPTYVLAHLNSGEVFSSWDATGHRINFANSANYKNVATNSNAIESQIELEKSDLTTADSQSKEEGKKINYTVGQKTLPALQQKPGKITLWAMNTAMKAMGLNFQIYEFNIVKASNLELDILKVFPTLYSKIDAQYGTKQDGFRVSISSQVLEVGKIK
jgi:hypothetical protein